MIGGGRRVLGKGKMGCRVRRVGWEGKDMDLLFTDGERRQKQGVSTVARGPRIRNWKAGQKERVDILLSFSLS